MSFRRIPFQFSTTDPAERQRELEKRFGVPMQDNNMYIDANPLSMSSGFNTSTSSPRFQHRVPMFVDGMSAQSSVDSLGCENKAPRVRVIPIEVETDERSPSSRHRTFSGPAVIPKHQDNETGQQKDNEYTLKRSMEDLSKPSKMKAAPGPRVYNVPIKVEHSGVREKKTKPEKGKMSENKSDPKVNVPNMSKHDPNVEPEPANEQDEVTKRYEAVRMKININNSLKKIDNVMEELKSYEKGVNEFNGTAKDKQYRYLDEMLTRCMIKLDDIETMGNEEVRSSRKKVVKMVQACIDLLESKVNIANNSNTSENTNSISKEDTENQDMAEPSTGLGENATEANEKSNIVDTPNGNQVVTNNDENKLPQIGSEIQEGMHVESSLCEQKVEKNNEVPEVEMDKIILTSSEVNHNENTDIVFDQSRSEQTNAVSDEIRQSSDNNEVEMIEETTQINLHDQKESPKSEVLSTKILQLKNGSGESAQKNDLIEADMTDISSTCENSSENQTSKPILLQDKNSNSNSNLVSSIPEVDMREIDENSCKTDLDDKLCILQSSLSTNNEPV